MHAPCKDCSSRQLGCHTTCSDYLCYVAENERKKQIIKKQKEIDQIGFKPKTRKR